MIPATKVDFIEFADRKIPFHYEKTTSAVVDMRAAYIILRR
jgi:hypothetical protein